MRKVTHNPQFWYNPIAKKAYWYAHAYINTRWIETEIIIMKHQHWAYMYACDVIKDRWPEAEPYIIKNSYYAFNYARNVINGRWLEAEDYILSSKWAKQYRNLFLNRQ